MSRVMSIKNNISLIFLVVILFSSNSKLYSANIDIDINVKTIKPGGPYIVCFSSKEKKVKVENVLRFEILGGVPYFETSGGNILKYDEVVSVNSINLHMIYGKLYYLVQEGGGVEWFGTTLVEISDNGKVKKIRLKKRDGSEINTENISVIDNKIFVENEGRGFCVLDENGVSDNCYTW